ncbi:MAG: hypothetical protein Athens071416_584 [Parcubacteria group bacterium Athens0714_16]|nr:MAG: hypothetical protein Athens071416_584 [Parcubacteria group bacterium Athens0714_16]
MRDFIKKKRYYKILYLRIILLVLIVLTVIFGKGAWNMYEKERIANENLINAERELSVIKGIEKELRKKFDVVKEGEKVIMIVDKKEGTENSVIKDKTGFWNWIKSIF